jgi:hypothetical protein
VDEFPMFTAASFDTMLSEALRPPNVIHTMQSL